MSIYSLNGIIIQLIIPYMAKPLIFFACLFQITFQLSFVSIVQCVISGFSIDNGNKYIVITFLSD